MSSLVIECFVVGPGGAFVTAERLAADPGMLGGRTIDIRANPNGGVTIDDDNEVIVIEDSLPDAAAFFLEDVLEAVHSGKSATYPFRTGEGEATVTVDGDQVTIRGYGNKSIETTVPILLDALAKAKQGFDELLKLGAPKTV
jgi:hypothetical protein